VRCHGRLRWLPRRACRRCQQAPGRDAEGLCAACAREPSPLAACVASVAYEGEVESWIRRFKYPRPGLGGLDPAPRAVLRDLVHDLAARAPTAAPDWVVPVPLHPRRLRARGFNPAALLAREVARRAGRPCAPLALERVRETASQTGLDRAERRRNVEGAFRAARPRPPARVWLVDDVVTTGATLSEAARILRLAGAREVVGLAAARTLQ
jgi:ComF family protein